VSIDIEVSVRGFDVVKRKLGEVVLAIDGDLTLEELVILAERTLELAQQTVAFRTGALRASLQIFIDPTLKRVSIGTDIGYGKYVELGTSKMAGRPFLFPSLLQAITEFKDRYPQRIKEFSRIGV